MGRPHRLVSLLLTALALPTSPALAQEEMDGPHAREALRHAGEPDAEWTRLVATPRPPHAPRTGPAVARRVYGYLPYWESIDLASFPWDLVTDIVVFSAELTTTGGVSNWHGWPQTGLIQAAHQHGVRVHLCATLFGSTSIATFLDVAHPERARDAVTRLVAAVHSAGADGLHLDFESPSASSRDAFTAFVEQAGAALRQRVPGAELTLAMPAFATRPGFNVPRLAAAADRLLLMEYDFHWRTGPRTGPVAPLTSGGTWVGAVDEAVGEYLVHVAPQKLALGVPWYGIDWPAAGAGPDALTTGAGKAVFAKDAVVQAQAKGRLWDAKSQTPWYTYTSGSTRRQCWYDDAESLALKYAFADVQNLGGVMIWALGYDGGRADLWDAIRAQLGPKTQIVGPRLELRSAIFTPRRLVPGGMVTASLTVKNTGDQAVMPSAPAPGILYGENESSAAATAGSWRVAVDVGDRPAAQPAHPWRWGLAAPLAPGGEAVIMGRVLLERAGSRVLHAALVQEGVGVVQDDVGTATVVVESTSVDAGLPEDAGPDATDAGEPAVDAGETDASVADGGRSGPSDAGEPADAATAPDAAVEPVDAGGEGGERDGAIVWKPDAGPAPSPEGCGCGAGGAAPLALLLVALPGVVRRRRI